MNKYTLVEFNRSLENAVAWQTKLAAILPSLGRIETVRVVEDPKSSRVYAELVSNPNTPDASQDILVIGYCKIGEVESEVDAVVSGSGKCLRVASVLPLHGTPRAIGIAVVGKEKASARKEEVQAREGEEPSAGADPEAAGSN